MYPVILMISFISSILFLINFHLKKMDKNSLYPSYYFYRFPASYGSPKALGAAAFLENIIRAIKVSTNGNIL